MSCFLALLQIVRSTDLGNECELQGQYLSTSNNNKLKVTVTGTTTTFEDGVLVVPGLFNVTSTASKVLDSYTKFESPGKYILVADNKCFSVSLVEHKEFKIYRRTVGSEDDQKENCDTFIPENEMTNENLIFYGVLIDGTETFCAYYIFGALVASLGSFCATLGMNLQKLT